MEKKVENMNEGWHLEQKVTISLILAILLNAASTIWWASKLDYTVSNHDLRLERQEKDLKDFVSRESFLMERLARIEANQDFQKQTLLNIKASLKK